MIEGIIIGVIVGYVIVKVKKSERAKYIIKYGHYVSKKEWEEA